MECIKNLLSGIGLMIFGIACFQLVIVSDLRIFDILGIIAILIGIVFVIKGIHNNLND